jgi:hypothetical protein
MSFSAKDRSQENARHTNHPSSKDVVEPADSRNITKDQTTGSEPDSLVEHILDFLDKYPARFAPRTALTGCIRAC